MRRLIWTLVALVTLGISLAALVVSPVSASPPPSGQQLGGAGGTGGMTVAKASPTPTPTPTHFDPIIYGGKYLDGKQCFDVSRTPVDMVKHDFGWSKDKLSPKYQHNGDGIKAPVIFLCNDYWPWLKPTTLTVRQMLTTLHWPADLVPATEAAQTITVTSELYGARGDNGKTCLGTSGSSAKMFKLDFSLDVTTDPILTIGYVRNPRLVLCNDYWPWVATDSGPLSGTNSLQDTITRMKWPADLITEHYQSLPITVKILADFDPTTATALIENAQQEQAKQNAPTGPCDWVPNLIVAHPHLNLCDAIKGVIQAVADEICQTFVEAQNVVSFLWTTPTQPFTDETSGLPGFWRLSWGLDLAFLAAVIAWIGLRMMAGASTSWLSYASALDVLPRLVVALLAAYFSKELLLGLISANNAFAAVFGDATVKSLLTQQANGTAVALLQIIYAVMAFLFIIEEAARMAVLYLLFAFAPILLFCAALRETEGVARASVIAGILFAFLQAIQLAILDVGGHIIDAVLTRSAGPLMTLQLLAGIAILYITLMLFFSVTRLAMGGIAMPLGSGALWASTSMMGRMARSVWHTRTTRAAHSDATKSGRATPSESAAGAQAGSLLPFRRNLGLLTWASRTARFISPESQNASSSGEPPTRVPRGPSPSGSPLSGKGTNGASGGQSSTPGSAPPAGPATRGGSSTSRSAAGGPSRSQPAPKGTAAGRVSSGGVPLGGTTRTSPRPPSAPPRPGLPRRSSGGKPPRPLRHPRPPQRPRP